MSIVDVKQNELIDSPWRPLLRHGRWYRTSPRQSSVMGSSMRITKNGSFSHIVSVLVVALGPIQFGFTNGYSSPTEDSIIKDLKLSTSEYSLFGSIVNVGAMVGALACGYMAECIGRKASLIVASIPNIIGWLAIAFARGSPLLLVGRFLEGFGVGVISYVVPVYIAEVSPQDVRGILGSVNQLASTAGTLLVYLIALFVNWRVLAIIGILPCALLIPGLFFIPESPRWLAKMGMTEEFETALHVLRGFDTDISVEANEIMQNVESTVKRDTTQFADLKRKRYWFPLMIGSVLLTLRQLSGINGIMFYSSTIFLDAGISSSNVATVILGAVQVIVTAISTWLVDKSGRRILLIISSSVMAFSLFLVAIAFYLEAVVSEDSHLYSILEIICVVGLLATMTGFSLGLGSIPWLIMSEIIPVNIKGLAGTVTTSLNWFNTWLVTLTASLLLSWSRGGTFTIYAVAATINIAFVVFLVPETKGRTLEEIQSSFS